MANIPTTIGRYQVVSKIGQGGMGTLYLAQDPKLDRQIVIKLLINDNEELRERFAREARSAARLRHPHIVTIFDVGEDEGQPFLAMEYVQGHTLAEIIRKKAPFTTAQKLVLVAELCDGLAFAHKAGIVHRDVKPANAMVDVNGSLKILDFGIARIAEAAGMTQAGMLMGTLNYMSPEQVAGSAVDSRSDIFAVGAVFYELLSYRQAFAGGLQDGILNRILQHQPEPLETLCPGLDPEIARVVGHALEKDLEKRYQDLGTMGTEVRRIGARLQSGDTPAFTIAVPAADAPTMAAIPGPMFGGPRRATDREGFARRRASQIQTYVDAAQTAIEVGEYESAITACEEALILDADERRAMELLDRARVALDERRAEECLAGAEQEISRGALAAALAMIEQAAAVVPTSPRAAELRKVVDEALRERERATQRAEAIRKALDRARANFDRGLLAEAVAAADEALALDPGLSEASALKVWCAEAIEAREREALDRRARETVREARRLFAKRTIDAALDLLVHFEPKHDLVSQTLDELRQEAERLAEQRRLEAALRAKQEMIATELLKARTEIGHAQFSTALDRLRALEQAEGGTPEIASLMQEAKEAQAAQERAAEIARRIAEHVELASGLFKKDDFTGALTQVDAALALDPDHQPARSLGLRIHQAVKAVAEAEERRLRERRRAVAAEIEKAALAESAAIAALRSALEIDPDNEEARKLLERREHAASSRLPDDQQSTIAAGPSQKQVSEEVAKAAQAARERAAAEQAKAAQAARELAAAEEAKAAQAARERSAAEQAKAAQAAQELAAAEEAKAAQAARERAAEIARAAEAARAAAEEAKAAQAARERAAEIARAAEMARNVDRHIEQALGLLKKGDFTGATAQVDAAQALDATSPQARDLRVKIQGEQAAAERREAEERRVRERRQAVAAEIEKAEQSPSHEGAIAALRRALALDPDHVKARKLLERRQGALDREQAQQRRRDEADKRRAAEATPVASAPPRAADPPSPAVTADPAAAAGVAVVSPTPSESAAMAPPPAVAKATSPAARKEPALPAKSPTRTGTYAALGVAAALVVAVVGYLTFTPRGDGEPASVASPAPVGTVGTTASTPFDTAPPAPVQVPTTVPPVSAPVPAASAPGAPAVPTNSSSPAAPQKPTESPADNRARIARGGVAPPPPAARGASPVVASPSAAVSAPAAVSVPSPAGSAPAPTVSAPAVTAPSPAVSAPSTSAPVAAPTTPAASSPPIAAPSTPVAGGSTPAPATSTPAVAAPSAPPVATPAAPAAAPPAARPAAPAVSEEAAVRAVVQAYADAYSSLDVGGVRRVYPGVREADLAKSFAALRSQRVQIQNDRIAVAGTTATVTCTWAATVQPRVGNSQTANASVTLTLQKSSGGNWIIVDRR